MADNPLTKFTEWETGPMLHTWRTNLSAGLTNEDMIKIWHTWWTRLSGGSLNEDSNTAKRAAVCCGRDPEGSAVGIFHLSVTHIGKENCPGILPALGPVYTSMHLWANQFKGDTCLTPPRCKLPRACLIVVSTGCAQGCPSTSPSYVCMGKWDQIRNSFVRPSADIICFWIEW